MNFLKMLGISDDKNDVSAVFNDNKKVITAEMAYQQSKFGALKTDKQLLEEFFVKVRDLIAQKNFEHSYCGMVEVGADILHFLPKIVNRLMVELGFKVIVLDDNSEIINDITGQKDKMNCGSTFILLIWNKQAIEDASTINANNRETNKATETIDTNITDVIDSSTIENKKEIEKKPLYS